MKPLHYFEHREVEGWVRVTPATSEDRIGPLYVECLSCPTLVPFPAHRLHTRKRVRRFIDGRPLCLECSHEVDEAEYEARMEGFATTEREWLEGIGW